MDWPSAIIHVDMDTFFVSVERKNDPDLMGKPIIVGGGPGGEMRRGVVAACSYETRAFGVHSAMPLTQALRRCPQAIVIPPGRSNYEAASAEVRASLEKFTDRVEMASIDEAYIDLEGTRLLHGCPIDAADKLRRQVVSDVGLPVSIGLAASRTFAKIASKLSKPRGLFVVFPGCEAALAAPLPLRALPGLGPKTAERLTRKGKVTLGEMIALGEDRLVEMFGENGSSLYRRVTGRGSAEIQKSRKAVSISSEVTFAEDLTDLALLHGRLAKMAMDLGRRLRRKDYRAGTLTLKLRYPDFTTLTRQAPLVPATHDDTILLRESKAILNRAWDGRTGLRLLGLGVSNLTAEVQEDLFSAQAGEKHERLLETIDAIGEREGRGKIVWGGAMKRSRPADKPGRQGR